MTFTEALVAEAVPLKADSAAPPCHWNPVRLDVLITAFAMHFEDAGWKAAPQKDASSGASRLALGALQPGGWDLSCTGVGDERK